MDLGTFKCYPQLTSLDEQDKSFLFIVLLGMNNVKKTNEVIHIFYYDKYFQYVRRNIMKTIIL